MNTLPVAIARASLMVTLVLLLSVPGRAADLESGFRAPPADARPWVYWFWLNGNISSNGITADLEAMKRVGIGGALIMEVDQGAPLGPVDFMSKRWRSLFQHVHAEARRLGLEINMNNDAGWNGSGGPWIKPEQSMQKVVWSETNVIGPARCEAKLAQPEMVADFYRDIAVLAFPTPGNFRIPDIRPKAMFEIGWGGGISREKLPAVTVERSGIVTLTSQMDAQGRIAWDIPAGQWTILRFGHTSTGAENAPAPKSGRGLECDKLSKAGIEANFAGMLAQLAADCRLEPGKMNHGLVATHIDSWENGAQNWTATMRAEFMQRRGYDLFPFLPVLTGRVIDNLEISERFLWDLRQTVSELVIENYAGRMRELAHQHGMRFTVEAYGSPCDSIPYAGQSDEPMGEFWTPSGAIETCRAMASAGHVYEKPIIGAEAFTSGDQEKWREHPAVLKVHGDRAFCEGINRFVFHRYALQPWAKEHRPGMMMGPWGQHYERTQTWWEWTPAWHEYLARCQFLLRQGLFVADICYLQPEAPAHGPGDYKRGGYSWDECTADAVLTRMSVSNGRIVLPDGMSYRLLVLPARETMTPRLLRKIRDLVEAGATVLGTKPASSPSLTDYPACDAEVKRIGDDLWQRFSISAAALRTAHATGEDQARQPRGRIVTGLTPEKMLEADGIAPDFTSGQPLRFIHRHAGETDLYFLSNPQPYEFTTTCQFRIAGKVPELWWPDTGRIERAAVWESKSGLTRVSIQFDPAGSVFVVFRQPQRGEDSIVAVRRDGKSVISAKPEPPVKFLVRQAHYGLLDDPARTKDVREKVQNKVDGGEYSFPVSTMAEGGDPAAGQIKTLAVEYEVDGRRFQVKATDPTSIHLSRSAVSIRVEKARYGVLDDPNRTRDVQEKLQRLIDSGVSSFTVATMAQGDDPAFLVVKTLQMEYLHNGQRYQRSAQDPDTIDLSPSAAPPKAPAALRSDTAGRAYLEASEPGQYELVTSSGRTQRVPIGRGESVELSGPWQVHFTPNSGAPEQLQFERLISWSEHSISGVKYFSGEAVYSKTFVAPGFQTESNKVYLDLGRVEIMAAVKLNGKDMGLLWKPPFHLDVTDTLARGTNTLEIRVVNLWPNRLIGDEQLPEDSDRNADGTLKSWPEWVQQDKASPTGRQTFSMWRLWKKSDALLDSGLIGPVTLQAVQQPCLRGSGP
jgi:hypothetical protein